MKKIAILAIVLFALSTTYAAAWTTKTYAAADSSGSLVVGSTVTATVKLSKSVSLGYGSQATGLGYTVGASHASGTKSFASSSGDSKIWSIDALTSTLPDAPSGTAGATWTSWTAL